jgi:hypothetical protein
VPDLDQVLGATALLDVVPVQDEAVENHGLVLRRLELL